MSETLAVNFRRFIQILDYAYLFFALVILSTILWMGAGFVLVAMPLFSILSAIFPRFSGAIVAVFAFYVAAVSGSIYVAAVSGSIGLFWGLKRWRRHLAEEANRATKIKK